MSKTINIRTKNIRKNAGWDPDVRVDSFPCSEKMDIIDRDELITPLEILSVMFEYPLSHSAVLIFKKPGGFTRLDLFRVVFEGYTAIYDEEKAAADRDDVMPYGIWGHLMDDLVIEEIKINSDGFVELEIGS